MEEKYNAICIRSVSYKDNDKMLTLFSLEEGIVECILRGVKKQGAKLKFAAELFCFAEYVLVEKNGRRTVVEANQLDDFYDIRMSVDKYYSASAIIEFLRAFCQKGESYYDLFLNTINAFRGIEDAPFSPSLFLVKYYMESLKVAGYGITFSHCDKCRKAIDKRAFFDFNECTFKCLDCADSSSTEMRFTTYEFLRLLSETTFEKLRRPDLSTYSPTFFNIDTIKNALKFFDFFLRDKIGVEIKSNVEIVSSDCL